MNISEYIKTEKEKMKEKSLKERLVYFWDYYKWYVLIVVVALVLIGQTVSNELSKKEKVMQGILIDGVGVVEAPAILQDFYEAYAIDPEKQEVYLNTGLSLNSGIPSIVSTSYQRIHAGIGAQDTDFMMGYEYAIQRFAYDTGNVFADLRDLFSPEELANLEGKLYYIDASVVQKIKDNPQEEIPLPDPQKPQDMENPVPVAVDISASEAFTSVYYTDEQRVYIAVITNALNKDLAADFIAFLLSDIREKQN